MHVPYGPSVVRMLVHKAHVLSCVVRWDVVVIAAVAGKNWHAYYIGRMEVVVVLGNGGLKDLVRMTISQRQASRWLTCKE